MAWFGKSEEELKNWQQELDAREKSLNGKQAELDRHQSDLTNRDTIVKAKSEELAKKDADIWSREKEITQRELDAKNAFVKEQREAFKQAIEVQLKEIDSRGQELNAKQNEIESQLSDLKKLEGDLAKKERSLKEKELTAENGFADKNKIALREVEKREADCKTLEARLQDREEAIALRHQEQENKAEELRKREVAIAKAEQERDEGFSAERKKLDDDLSTKRSAFEKELSERRTKELNSLEKLLSEEATKRRESLDKELSVERSQFENSLKTEKSALTSLKETLNSKSAELDELKDELDYKKQRLQSSKDRLEEREANLNLEVDRLVESERVQLRKSIEQKDREIKRYIEDSTSLQELLNTYKKLEHDLGEDPQKVKDELAKQVETIKSLQADLANRPLVKQEEFDRLKSEREAIEQERDRYKNEYQILYKSQQDQDELEAENDSLKRQNRTLADQRDNIEAHNNQLQADIKRFQSAYEREQDREARIRDIETPYIKKELPRAVDKVEELQWLDGISKSCIDYGLRFPRRILHAFHTALKTSEWSLVTVLAGVSGTGKSQLPKLYSHFGGINFLSLSVQPNWDSQESMLGFFNSIVNKFDAQPVLRLLAQSQKAQAEGYPLGLEDVMSLILMDEMNLAHVELYFAEFLSKLELRRGLEPNNVPCLEVKLGAGVPDYDLPLGRNVMWVGTMNQDETTKSLSDKVLDRGIVINFPRPTKLERRSKNVRLGDPSPLLPKKIFQSWWCKDSKFKDDQILPFKGFIEDMNTSLSKVGRALGHRVWQSIEYYMSNYPDVQEAQRNNDEDKLARAMKIAFEDQLVQKVMPKLRGIETRGNAKTNCIDKIEAQIKEGIKEYKMKDGTICKPLSAAQGEFSIGEDYKLAYEMGYGQFIWNSANYLKDDVSSGERSNGDFSMQMQRAIDNVSVGISISKDQATLLVENGFNGLELLKSCDLDDIKQIEGISKKTLSSIQGLQQ